MKELDLYLIPTASGRHVLFAERDTLIQMESESGDRVQQFISWVVRRRNRFVSWAGRVLKAGHDYYVQLEDKIDPAERVLKAMACTNRFVIQHVSPRDNNVRGEFEGFLKRQRLKHAFWFSIDFIATGIVIVLTPFLAPIPGPNVFFYYPFLRLLSHYRALLGITSGLRSSDVQFKSLPGLSGLEENLPGLSTFLERVN